MNWQRLYSFKINDKNRTLPLKIWKCAWFFQMFRISNKIGVLQLNVMQMYSIPNVFVCVCVESNRTETNVRVKQECLWLLPPTKNPSQNVTGNVILVVTNSFVIQCKFRVFVYISRNFWLWSFWNIGKPRLCKPNNN